MLLSSFFFFFFFFNDTATTEIYTLSLHDALPILPTAAKPSTTPRRSNPTWSSWTCGCPASTASLPPASPAGGSVAPPAGAVSSGRRQRGRGRSESCGRDGLRTVAARAVLVGDRRPVGQAPADLVESCVLGLESLGHGTAAAEAGGNSGERRHHEHGC